MANELIGAELRKGSGFCRKGEGFTLVFGETWHYRVRTDQITSSRFSVLYDTPGLPRAGLLYGPLQLICDDVTCEREGKHAQYWSVTANFRTGSEQQRQNEQQDPNPATWIPFFKIDSFATKEKVLAKDRTSPTPKAGVNSAGTPFDQPLTTTTSLCQFSFVQFDSPSLKLKDYLDRNDTVNSHSFNTGREVLAARTMLIEVQEAELGTYAGYQAWRAKYRVTYDPDTHDDIRADIGPFFKEGGLLKRYMDDTKTFGIVGALNGSGAKTTTPAELSFRVKKEDSLSWIRVS